MDRLEWRLPAGMRVFHFGAPGPKSYPLDNPIVLRRPILSLDPAALSIESSISRAILNDKHTHLRVPILHQIGRFVICGRPDTWPCFRYVDGERYALITELRIVPLSFREAKEYVQQYHRHNAAPQGHKFSIGLIAPNEDRHIGVAIASIPKARHLNDGFTLELNRVCCDPAFFNACSKLYGAAVKVGKAMGYINLTARYDEETWETKDTHETRTGAVLYLEEIEFAGGGNGQKNGQSSAGGTVPQSTGGYPAPQPQGQPGYPQGQPPQPAEPMPGNFTGFEGFAGGENPFF